MSTLQKPQTPWDFEKNLNLHSIIAIAREEIREQSHLTYKGINQWAIPQLYQQLLEKDPNTPIELKSIYCEKRNQDIGFILDYAGNYWDIFGSNALETVLVGNDLASDTPIQIKTIDPEKLEILLGTIQSLTPEKFPMYSEGVQLREVDPNSIRYFQGNHSFINLTLHLDSELAEHPLLNEKVNEVIKGVEDIQFSILKKEELEIKGLPYLDSQISKLNDLIENLITRKTHYETNIFKKTKSFDHLKKINSEFNFEIDDVISQNENQETHELVTVQNEFSGNPYRLKLNTPTEQKQRQFMKLLAHSLFCGRINCLHFTDHEKNRDIEFHLSIKPLITGAVILTTAKMQLQMLTEHEIHEKVRGLESWVNVKGGLDCLKKINYLATQIKVENSLETRAPSSFTPKRF